MAVKLTGSYVQYSILQLLWWLLKMSTPNWSRKKRAVKQWVNSSFQLVCSFPMKWPSSVQNQFESKIFHFVWQTDAHTIDISVYSAITQPQWYARTEKLNQTITALCLILFSGLLLKSISVYICQFFTRITLIQIMSPTFFFFFFKKIIIKLTDCVKRIRQEWQSNGALCTSDVQ